MGTVSGLVWYDKDFSGTLTPGDPPYVNRSVEIRWVNGTVLATVNTNSTGGFTYSTDQLYPGMVLLASAANGVSRTLAFTTDADGNMKMMIPVPSGVIQGYVFHDFNTDGILSPGDLAEPNLNIIITFPNRLVCFGWKIADTILMNNPLPL